MSVRRPTATIRWAACAAAAVFSAALAPQAGAQQRPTNADQELGIILGQTTFDPDAADAAGRAPARRPLMSLLDRVGLGETLDASRIEIYGHVQGSYTYNTDDPSPKVNVGRVFDFEHDELTLNQVDLNIERRLNLSGEEFDIGGRMEFMWGADARFIHSSGLFDHFDPEGGDTTDITDGPENQPDLVQLYADFGIPVGNGLRIRAGKFLFFKQIDPNASVFYSHSFTFGAALPFTLTGITGYYEFTDRMSVEAGVVRGWDDALEDDNDKPSYVGRVRYRASDEWNMSLAAITGPELEDDDEHYRTAINFSTSYQFSSNFTMLLDAVYGYQSQAPGEGASDWYGAAAYGIYKFNDYVSAAARLEYYRDDEGFTTGLAGAGPFLGFSSQSLYGATVGLTITPFADDELGRNFKVRPEVRYDRSSEEFFDGFTEKDQITLAVDAIFNF